MNKNAWLTAFAGLCLALLTALVGWCLWQARGLQLRLDHAYVAAEAARVLAPLLGQTSGDRRLRPAVDGLIQRRDLALRYLAVRDADGVLLTRAGVIESLHLPWVPEEVQQRLRLRAYALLGSSGSERLFDAERRLVGSFDYSLDPGDVDGVQVEAVNALRLAGWLALALAIPVGGMFVVGLRRHLRQPPAWSWRADPQARLPGGDGGVVAQDDFRERAGALLDALDYGMIVTDREARILYLNSGAERLTGWSAGDARGRLLYSVFHAVDAAGEPQHNPAERVLETGRAQAPEIGQLRQRQGALVPVEMSAHPVRARPAVLDGAMLLFRDTTPHQRELDVLRREARLSQAVVDHLDEGLLTTDMAGVVRSANARAERMFGYARDELVGFTITKLMPVPFLNAPNVRITDYISGRAGGGLPKVVGWRKDATTFPVELWVQTMRAEGADGLVVIVRDISERLRGENLASRLGRLLDNATEEVYIFDAQSLLFLEVNRGGRRNLGYRPEQLTRMTPLDMSEELDADSFRNYLTSLRGGDTDHVVYRCRHRRADGSSYPVEVRLNFSRDEEPPVFMAIATNITERIAYEEKLNQLAHFDSLTGLPNRIMLFDRLQQAVLAAQRSSRLLGVFFLDLDRFKQINDSYGHETGDQVLVAVADRLRSTVRPSDTVARLAGDEFVIIAPGLRSDQDAEFLAQKLVERFEQPLDLPGRSITSRLSVGITLYPLDDSDVEGLLRHADSAMYQAKQSGRGCYRLFTTQIDPDRRRQHELERDIHAAVALNQFELSMAPACDANGRVHVLLSRLRWQHSRHGWIEQDEIWQAAGRAGLIADVELWQIGAACEQLQTAGGWNLPRLPHVLRLSGWQLRDRDFISHVLELIDRYHVPPSCLVFALTPDGLIEAGSRHADCAELIRRGVRFALRHFNVMPASSALPLSYVLAAGPVIGSASAIRALLGAIPADTGVIATRVGSAEELARVRSAGIDCVSGHAIAADVSGPRLIEWLKTARPARISP
ncbi:diguanylate cyclase [Fontimonas sp. SYSU GA230001]|uniref:sensor domain-containing protein n=1 Tax=Fontimonas sp. SYSU GA230001 TaxID=3142450 RepID=UPI0032B3C274